MSAVSVHVQTEPDGDAKALLQSRVDDRIVLSYGPDVDPAADCRVLVAGRPSPDVLDAAPGLEVLVIP